MAQPLRSIRIHTLRQAEAALAVARELDVAVSLESPEGAAGWQGIGWWRALMDRLSADGQPSRCTFVLDCGDAPGLALAALRSGCPVIRLRATTATTGKIEAIARQLGAAVFPPLDRPFLDLLDAADPAETCRRFLAQSD